MEKKELHAALVYLMQKLSQAKDTPMQDKNFVESLTTVLRYFRDNGELKQAFKTRKESLESIKESPWCKMMLAACNAKLEEFGGDIRPVDVNQVIENMTSDKHIDKMIEDTLGE